MSVTPLDAAHLRLSIVSMLEQKDASLPIDQMIEKAKKLEAYAWGGFAPVIKPPTQLSTISEAAQVTLDMLNELIENCADEGKRDQLVAVRPQWERFIADLNNALGE